MHDRLSNLDRHPAPEAFTAGFGVWPMGETGKGGGGKTKKKGKSRSGKAAKPKKSRGGRK